MRRKNTAVTGLTRIAPEIADLDGALVHEGTQRKGGCVQRHSQSLRELALRKARVLLRRRQHAESDVLVEGGHGD